MGQSESIARKGAKSGVWFAGYRLISQAYSWTVTILVARMLQPEDYGLMAMAGVLTMYLEMFSEMGLGSAIVQRERISQNELSSLFWFALPVGGVMACLAYALASPTAWIMDEPRVVPLTHTIAALFVVAALMIVPHHLLQRQLRFKAIGALKLAAVVIASTSMLVMAAMGFGVWTLLLGTVILRTLTTLFTILTCRWVPSLHFRIREVFPFLRFGASVALSNSLIIMRSSLLQLIIGRAMGARVLGYYSYAFQLAAMPNRKVMAMVHQVCFPIFSRYSSGDPAFSRNFLRMQRYVVITMCPLFLVGFLFGEQLIQTVLSDKWMGASLLFRLFCLAQFLVCMTVMVSVVNYAQGRPHWELIYNATLVLLLPASMWIALRYGSDALAYPWLLVFPLVAVAYNMITARAIKLSFRLYARSVLVPGLTVALAVFGASLIGKLALSGVPSAPLRLTGELAIVFVVYAAYLGLFERDRIRDMRSLWRG